MPDTTFHRCSHCRGFYESDLHACKYCQYQTVFTNANNSPKIFPDRATCRALQIAEYEQLPPEAMSDPFKPPHDELAEICGCLHCGPEGFPFEAVEMRWMVTEQMWACPCTTCGGRGFTFDIHSISPKWECNNCRHKWSPPNGNCKPSNCKCPKCGSTEASGMFQDEYSEEEIEAMTDEQYEEYFGISRVQEEKERQEYNEKWNREQAERKAAGIPDDAPPWQDPIAEDPDEPAEDFTAYNPEARTGEDNADAPPHAERLPDDIDFPRPRSEDRGDSPPLNENDIPF